MIDNHEDKDLQELQQLMEELEAQMADSETAKDEAEKWWNSLSENEKEDYIQESKSFFP